MVYHGVSKEAVNGRFIKNSAYVHIDLNNFKQHILYLKKKYRIISLERLCGFIHSGAQIPDYTVVITFDDGYRNVLENAYPLLRDYGIACSIFLTGKLTNNNDWLWLDKLEYMADITRKETVNIFGRDYNLKNKLLKRRFLNSIRDKLKRVNEETRNRIMQDLILKLDVDIPRHPLGEYGLLSYEQARQMDKRLISFGAHTPEHTILTLENNEKIRLLILQSKQEISHQLQRDMNLFSYPNGNYNNSIKEILKENGFICGLTTNYGMNGADADLFELKRISVSSEDSLIPFIANLSGIRKYSSSLMQFLRKPIS